jgi:hypothetical protein
MAADSEVAAGKSRSICSGVASSGAIASAARPASLQAAARSMRSASVEE